jgi:elongation factor G
MGELHLDIYVERMKREYNVACTTSKPRVAYRETPTEKAAFAYTHKKQTGGAGQFGRVMGYIEPMEKNEESGKDVAFENWVTGGNIPIGYIPAVEKVMIFTSAGRRTLDRWRRISQQGFRDGLEKGALSGHAISGVRFVLEDGSYHAVDSSELAFRLAAVGAFKEAYLKSKPVILEPIMSVDVVAPVEFQGTSIVWPGPLKWGTDEMGIQVL